MSERELQRVEILSTMNSGRTTVSTAASVLVFIDDATSRHAATFCVIGERG